MSFLVIKVFSVCGYAVVVAWLAIEFAISPAVATLLTFSIAMLALIATRQSS